VMTENALTVAAEKNWNTTILFLSLKVVEILREILSCCVRVVIGRKAIRLIEIPAR